MKNKKIIATIAALLVASVGFVAAASGNYIADVGAAEVEVEEPVGESETVETITVESLTSEETTAETEGVSESASSEIEVLEIEASESVETSESSETSESLETELIEETTAETEEYSITISFVDKDGNSLADDIVASDAEEALDQYEVVLNGLITQGYVVVTDEVASFDTEAELEDDVLLTVTLKEELEFDVESATVNGIYVPNIIFTDNGHTAVYYLDDGTEIASLSDYDLPMTVEVWRCRGIDKYFEVCCGGRYDLDDDTLEQIHIAGEMIFNGEG